MGLVEIPHTVDDVSRQYEGDTSLGQRVLGALPVFFFRIRALGRLPHL